MPRRKQAATEERPPEIQEAELDRDIAEDFQERQNLSDEGRDQLARKLRAHNSLSPVLSAGDVDAAWDSARESGEETFTGHAPTPDQDRVDDLGAAAGLTYKDDEPLQYTKVSRRDERRWELDPRSGQEEQAMDEHDEAEDEDDAADADNAPLRFWDLADDLDAEVEEEYEDEDEDEEDEEDEEDVKLAAEEDEDPDEDTDAEAEVAEDDELDSDLDEDLLEADELDGDLDELDDLDDDEDDFDDDED